MQGHENSEIHLDDHLEPIFGSTCEVHEILSCSDQLTFIDEVHLLNVHIVLDAMSPKDYEVRKGLEIVVRQDDQLLNAYKEFDICPRLEIESTFVTYPWFKNEIHIPIIVTLMIMLT
ncbi:hypothetical protein RND81_06G252200 [Saponaria officinalis]|uniref:Uncharacterized protein n=1 Tax=Saponaria officinalis TaxID=3572 RepID=A0AAW1KEA6_SAPOF